MTLQQLKYALTVADCGSMNEAAKRLFLSQPGLSETIRELEREIGLQIFLRSNRGIVITPEGDEFLGYARQVTEQFEILTSRFVEKRTKEKFSVSMQHYTFAVKAFVDMAKQFDMSQYEFAIRETKTASVIRDVSTMKSEIGVLYLCDFNRKSMEKLLKSAGLEFHHLIDCQAYVYLWKGHPLAEERSICFEQLKDYPCLSFEQGDDSSFYLAEEILSTNEYARIIKANDRATMLNLMVGLNGYTLCSGIICEELNGSDYRTIPFEDDEKNHNSVMEIGYIVRRNTILSRIGGLYVEELKRCLGIA